MPAVALGGLIGSLALATPAAAEDASVKTSVRPLVLDEIPAEGSNPSASKTFWLNFDGGTVTDSKWNDQTGEDELNFEPASAFTDAHKLEAYQVVVQAFAPFDVNVTVNKPAADKLERSSMDDDEYGSIAHITDSNKDSPGFEKIFTDEHAGKAFQGSFGDPVYYDAWATTDTFGGEEVAPEVEGWIGRLVGETAAHELGHTVGLGHHGWQEGDTEYEYYTPGQSWVEETASVWGPRMGSPIAGMHRWSNGYPNDPDGDDDDLALMTEDLSEDDAKASVLYDGDELYWGPYCTNNQTGEAVKQAVDSDECLEDQPLKWETNYRGRLDYRSNKEAHSDSRARVLTIENGTASGYGEFVKNLKKGTGNWYVFDAAAGPINLSVMPQQPFTMLDLKVTLYDSNLQEIASADPGLENVYDGQLVVPQELKGQGASIDHNGAAPATYFVKVEQTSFGDIADNTKDKTVAAPRYGDLGVYQISVEGQATDELAMPTAGKTYGETVSGTGVAGAEIAVANSDGKVIGTATVGTDGTYEVKLDPAAKVGDELLVTQAKDGLKSRPLLVTVIEEEKPEISVKIDRKKITEGDDEPLTVTGSGFQSGQKVTGVVRSEPVELGTQVADEDGKVEFIFDGSKLEVGKHKVTLTAEDDEDYTGSATFTVAKAPEEEPPPDDDDDDKPSPSPSPDDEETPPSDDDNGSSDDDGMPPEDDGDGLPQTGASNMLTLFGVGGIALVGAGATIAIAARRKFTA